MRQKVFIIKFILSCLMGSLLLMEPASAGGLVAQQGDGSHLGSQNLDQGIESDNTGVNRLDRRNKKLTAEDQAKGSQKDQEITRRIRTELVSNSELSSYGQNIKIITLDGIVTLRGPVKSSQERDWIVNSAQKVSGVRSLQNEITIAE